MSEPVSPSSPNAPAAPARLVVNWRRVRIYIWSILLVAAMWMGGILVTIRTNPEWYVDWVVADLPYPHSHSKVFWINRRTLEITNVKWSNFFYADSITITASPFGLLRHHIAKVQIVGGQLFNKALYDEMDKHSGVPQGLNWTIARVEISRCTIMLQSYGPDVPNIPIRLGARHPIVLNNILLNKPNDSPEMTKERSIEIVNVNIVSPFDPVAPVMSFPLTRVRFTYTEMWHHHIRQITMIKPTLHLGEDLFWFTNEFKQSRNTAPQEGAKAPWSVDRFEVQYGRLAVNVFGQPAFHFPFFFDTTVNDIRLDQLDKISAKSTIAIRRLDQDYPDYKINVVGLTGRLYFSWPPNDDKANNVVNTIAIDEISWNDIPVKAATSTVTFDPDGVYGKVNGACEGGQLTGNFEFYYDKGFTWNADFFADKINCQPIAEKLGGKYVNLTGELDGKLSVQGKVTTIEKCEGSLTLPNPGVCEIKSLDNLLKSTENKVTFKDQAMRIAIESVRTYPYQNGLLTINYTPEGGEGKLKLNSPNGLRQFDMYWHPYDSSKVANDANNQ